MGEGGEGLKQNSVHQSVPHPKGHLKVWGNHGIGASSYKYLVSTGSIGLFVKI